MRKVYGILFICLFAAAGMAGPEKLSNEHKKNKDKILKQVKTELNYVTKQQNIDSISDIDGVKAYLTQLRPVLEAFEKVYK